MSHRLKIGQVASLLGISTKTVRHYQQEGLLPDRREGENGYRYFLPQDLLQLHKVIKLKGLGMSLAQVRAILKQTDQVHTMRAALSTLRKELTGQISDLQDQVARIDTLLAEEGDPFSEFADPLPHEEALRERLRTSLPGMDPAMLDEMLALDRKMFDLLKGFHWPGNPEAQFEQSLQQILANPETAARLGPILESFLGMLHGSPDAIDLQDLAGKIQGIRAELGLPDTSAAEPELESVFQELIARVLPGSHNEILAVLNELSQNIEKPPSS